MIKQNEFPSVINLLKPFLSTQYAHSTVYQVHIKQTHAAPPLQHPLTCILILLRTVTAILVNTGTNKTFGKTQERTGLRGYFQFRN